MSTGKNMVPGDVPDRDAGSPGDSLATRPAAHSRTVGQNVLRIPHTPLSRQRGTIARAGRTASPHYS